MDATIVQVVSDPAWAYLMTGATAVAGIAGTLWQARRTRQAEAHNLYTTLHVDAARARIAEKRRIYAQCFTAYHRLYSAALKIDWEHPRRVGRDDLVAYTEAAREALTAATELGLIAPDEVANPAGTALELLMQKKKLDTDAIGQQLIALPMAMRIDLGEEPISEWKGL